MLGEGGLLLTFSVAEVMLTHSVPPPFPHVLGERLLLFCCSSTTEFLLPALPCPAL